MSLDLTVVDDTLEEKDKRIAELEAENAELREYVASLERAVDPIHQP